MEQKCWYVVQSKPQKEAAVCAQLANFKERIECFLPKIRSHLGVRPLFPSYLFIKTRMEDTENYRLLRYTRGLLKIIGMREDKPIPVPLAVIDTIKDRLGEDGLIDQRKVMVMGRQVRVRKGPLKDLIGILEKPAGEEGRIQILFRLLKYPMRAVLKYRRSPRNRPLR